MGTKDWRDDTLTDGDDITSIDVVEFLTLIEQLEDGVLKDADGDTKIQVEESTDEDIIRFDTAGTERATLSSSGLDLASGLTYKINGTNLAASDVGALPTGTKLDDLSAPDDNTDLNASTSSHGLLPKLDSASSVKYLAGDGSWKDHEAGLQIFIDGGGAAITTGIKGWIEVPFKCQIKAVRLLADQSGSIAIDIWKDTYANYPPTDADSITASAVPTITTATKSENATLTGWTTTVAKGDILYFNVDSCTTITKCAVSLSVIKIP